MLFDSSLCNAVELPSFFYFLFSWEGVRDNADNNSRLFENTLYLPNTDHSLRLKFAYG